jgi:hypothetical protein
MENGNRDSRAGGTVMVVTFEAGDYFSKALLVTDTFGYVWSFSLGQRCIVTTVVFEFLFLQRVHWNLVLRKSSNNHVPI